MAEIHVSGLAELNKLLQTLPVKVEKNILRGALRAGMNAVKPEAQLLAAKASGAMAAGLKVGSRSKGGVVKGILRSTGIHGYIAMWVEFGTRAHFISVPEEEKAINWRRGIHFGKRVSMTTVNRGLRSLKIGNTFVGPTVFHPGARPNPFMRPALDRMAPAAVVAAGEYIKKRLSEKHGIDTGYIMVEGDE